MSEQQTPEQESLHAQLVAALKSDTLVEARIRYVDKDGNTVGEATMRPATKEELAHGNQ